MYTRMCVTWWRCANYSTKMSPWYSATLFVSKSPTNLDLEASTWPVKRSTSRAPQPLHPGLQQDAPSAYASTSCLATGVSSNSINGDLVVILKQRQSGRKMSRHFSRIRLSINNRILNKNVNGFYGSATSCWQFAWEQNNHSTSALNSALYAMLSRPSALHPNIFKLCSTAHHCVSSNVNFIAYYGIQKNSAVGTASSAVKFYGADGLDDFCEGFKSGLQRSVGVAHLDFTAHQRLVVGYTDSSLRVYDLTSGATLCCVPNAWTMNTITYLETLNNLPFPTFL